MILLALLELNKQEVTDWRKNFDFTEKSPFGLFVFSKEVDTLLQHQVSRTLQSPYAYYEENPKIAPHNILIIEREIDEISWEKILNQVQKGSDAMVISDYVPKFLSDSLKFYSKMTSFEEKQTLYFTDQKLQKDSLVLDKLPGGEGFSYIGKNNEILGKVVEHDNDVQTNFIKIPFGKGHFYVHSEPLILTNYYLLKPSSQKYVEDVFSYLPNRKTIWFTEKESMVSSSPMRFILAKPALRYAWWLFLGGLLIFAIFNAKRRQRIVPIIEPLKNKSVEFVRSIGNLYLQEGDFHDMMNKKAQYFLHKIRMDLLIDTKTLDDDFVRKLHLKTGKSTEKIEEALSLIKKAQDPYSAVMKEDLVRMNNLLDEILK